MEITANDHASYLNGLMEVVKKMTAYQVCNGFSVILSTYARIKRGEDFKMTLDDFILACEAHLGIHRDGDNVVIDALTPTMFNDPLAH